jgi:hypothetical protein
VSSPLPACLRPRHATHAAKGKRPFYNMTASPLAWPKTFAVQLEASATASQVSHTGPQSPQIVGKTNRLSTRLGMHYENVCPQQMLRMLTGSCERHSCSLLQSVNTSLQVMPPRGHSYMTRALIVYTAAQYATTELSKLTTHALLFTAFCVYPSQTPMLPTFDPFRL